MAADASLRSRQSIGRGLFPAEEDSLGTLKVPKVKPDRTESADYDLPSKTPGESQIVLMPRSKLDDNYLGKVFMGLFIFYMVVNIDNGALPASLPAWEHDKNFDFSNGEIGTLGAIGYVGMIAGAPLSGYLFGRFPPKNILVTGFAGNTLMVFLFGGAPNKICLFIARFMIGFTQACIFVFAPVWVDNFASSDKSSLWMALMQAANPLGVMIGYLLSIIFQSLGVEHNGEKGNMGFCPYGCSDPWFTWRIPFIIQGIGLLLLLMVFVTIDNYYIDPATIQYDEEEEEELNELRTVLENGEHSYNENSGIDAENGSAAEMEDVDIGLPEHIKTGEYVNENESEGEDDEEEEEEVEIPDTIFQQMIFLASNPIYFYVVLTLSTMYFVVTGIQFWVTKYLTDEEDGLGYDLVMVGIGFAIVSATSPVAGVIFGGSSVQKIGGYKNVYAALRLCSYFATAAVVAAVATAFITIFWLIMITIWLLLFFGGAIVPVLTGIMMAVTPQQLQPLASSMSITVFQILGYCAAPVLCGAIAEMKEFGLKGGFKVVLFWSGFGLLFNYCSMLSAWRRDEAKAERKRELNSLAMMTSIGANSLDANMSSSTRIESNIITPQNDGNASIPAGSIVRQNPLADEAL